MYLFIQNCYFCQQTRQLSNKGGKIQKIGISGCRFRLFSKLKKKYTARSKREKLLPTALRKGPWNQKLKHDFRLPKVLAIFWSPTVSQLPGNLHQKTKQEMKAAVWNGNNFTFVSPLPLGMSVNIRMIKKKKVAVHLGKTLHRKRSTIAASSRPSTTDNRNKN